MRNDKSIVLTLIYNSDKAEDVRIRSSVEAIPGNDIKIIDLKRTSITEDQIATLADKLNVNIEDLLDPNYDDHISVHNEGLTMASRSELLSLMAREPKLICGPIFFSKDIAYRYTPGFDVGEFKASGKAGMSRYTSVEL